MKDKSLRMMDEGDLIGMTILDCFAVKLQWPSQENMVSFHWYNIISNFIFKFANGKLDFNLMPNLHIPIFINPMKFIRFWMGYQCKVQLLNQPSAITIAT